MLYILFFTFLICVVDLKNCADIVHNLGSTTKRTNDILLNSSHPGNVLSNIPAKIIGGRPSKLGEWPWMVALFYKKKNNENKPAKYECGGTLISDQWVLTAAHCLESDNKLTYVRLGDLDLDDEVEDGATPVNMKIKKTIRHSEYDGIKMDNDIGLIRLKNKIKFTKYIQPIGLLNRAESKTYDKYYLNEMATVAGWGMTRKDDNRTKMTMLKHTQIRLRKCQNIIKYQKKGETTIDYRILCAGDPKNACCYGDSGGPLMFENKTSSPHQYYQVGIVSWGEACAQKNFPDVYTRVAAFIDWIHEKTRLVF